jgi:hypothetical protein
MPREITAYSNPLVKRVRSLRDKKHRRDEGLFLAEGLRILAEAEESACCRCGSSSPPMAPATRSSAAVAKVEAKPEARRSRRRATSSTSFQARRIRKP